MISFEYTATMIVEMQSIIAQLAEIEEQVEAAKRTRDRDLRSRLERESQRLRARLLANGDPAAIYLFAVSTGLINSDTFRTEWQSQAKDVGVSDLLRRWHLDGFFDNLWDWNDINLLLLPRCSFALTFTFCLARPYLSKDDDAFYIIDNPVRKDKVFKLPMVAPSSWKGSLRHALWKLDARHDGKAYHDDRIKRLFGETRDDDTGQSGRLFFHPTFFDRIGLEIINPHDRVRRVGKNPILFESVPAGTTGRFTLLYVPFDRIGNEEADPEKDLKSLPEEVAEDLTLVARGLQAMFTLYGFGAKTSSGFGLAEDSLAGQGSLTLHMEDDTTQPPENGPQSDDPMQTLQADIDAFLKRFGVETFPRWTNDELKASGWGKKRQSEYKKLRKRHPDWDAQAGQWREATPEESADEEAPPPPLTERAFTSFSELIALSESLAARLNAGGEA